MHIAHVAIWTGDLERLRIFYEWYFGAIAGPKYVNSAKQFESYFLELDSGARLEIMTMPAIQARGQPTGLIPTGYAHVAISVGSRPRVDDLTNRLRTAGYPVLDGPRTTGDGYYESVVLDPDGNRLEITA